MSSDYEYSDKEYYDDDDEEMILDEDEDGQSRFPTTPRGARVLTEY